MRFPRVIIPVCIILSCSILLPKAYCEDYKSPYATNWEYHNPTGDSFPIMASDIVPVGMPITHQALQWLEECGFNLADLNPAIRNIPEALQNAKGTSVLFDIDLPHLTHPVECMKAMSSYRHEPRVAMFDFGDEKPVEEQQKIAVSYNDARDSAITQLPIFNNRLFKPQMVADKEYTVYDELKRLEVMFRPAVWCYDHYPVLQKFHYNHDPQKETAATAAYVNDWTYSWLEDFRNISNATKRPFWYYVQSMEYEVRITDREKNPTDKMMRRPISKEYMTFSTFSALAYGAKGLRFWTYALRKSNKNETYITAPINLEGKRTKVWHMVKDVISEVRANEDIYLNSEVEEVYHSGTLQFRGTTPQPKSVGPFSLLQAKGEAGVLTSLMRANGKGYVMIVNHDINNKQRVEGRAKGYGLTRKGGAALKKKKGDEYVITLSPGGYILIEYDKSN